MPGLEELMALQGGGGGGAPQMPQGGGDPRMAQAMQMKLQQLMQDPAARAGMQAHMQGGDPRQAGAQVAMQDPRMGAAMRGMPSNGPPSTDGRGPATDSELYDVQEANQGVRGNLPPIPDKGGYTGYADEDAPEDIRQTPMPLKPGEEQDMVSREIDRKGATFDGTDAPTQNDIDRLLEAPTDAMCEAFDVHFGDGAAAQYINNEDTSPKAPPPRGSQAPDPYSPRNTDGDADDE